MDQTNEEWVVVVTMGNGREVQKGFTPYSHQEAEREASRMRLRYKAMGGKGDNVKAVPVSELEEMGLA